MTWTWLTPLHKRQVYTTPLLYIHLVFDMRVKPAISSILWENSKVWSTLCYYHEVMTKKCIFHAEIFPNICSKHFPRKSTWSTSTHRVYTSSLVWISLQAVGCSRADYYKYELVFRILPVEAYNYERIPGEDKPSNSLLLIVRTSIVYKVKSGG